MKSSAIDRAWVAEAVKLIEADFNRSSDTHLIILKVPELEGIDIYLKDETSHPTGSLKHRLARSLFLYGLANGWINSRTTIIEASSGSTAVSEAYFARLIGLPFIAVIPKTTSPDKISAIQFQGGTCHMVEDPCSINGVAADMAASIGGHYMDQFTFAERATDWRSNNNIAESIFSQMNLENYPIPEWIVCCAGTGGTAATLGRYVRYRRHNTKILCVDPENSVFFKCYENHLNGGRQVIPEGGLASRIEGIGRPKLERSFIPTCIDAMLKVQDQHSLAGMRKVSEILGRKVGGSTGTNFIGIIAAARSMLAAGKKGSIVSIICDDGSRYEHSYYSEQWYSKSCIPMNEADKEFTDAFAGAPLAGLKQLGDIETPIAER